MEEVLGCGVGGSMGLALAAGVGAVGSVGVGVMVG